LYGADRTNRQIALRMGNDNAPPQNAVDKFVVRSGSGNQLETLPLKPSNVSRLSRSI
jgi:hypothetical protein